MWGFLVGRPRPIWMLRATMWMLRTSMWMLRATMRNAAPSEHEFATPPFAIQLLYTDFVTALGVSISISISQEEGEELFGVETVRHMGGLRVTREIELEAEEIDGGDAPIGDIAMSGTKHLKPPFACAAIFAALSVA
eukprot:9498439-Pyramimonas_sp.AAC.1